MKLAWKLRNLLLASSVRLIPWVVCYMATTAQLAAQSQNNYPKGYFRNPMDIPIFLSGNYGECRPNHFHTGIDIKTDQKENLPVRAAAEGFVSRISISHTGYGNALYIDHPNGYRTVYAHLNDFAPDIMKFAQQEQYKQRRWNIDIQVPPGALPVKQSSLIALSGNTGGSVAPHLHFEIRNIATEEVINAALFGFEINDNLPPVVHSIAIYDATRSIYNQLPHIIYLTKKNGVYTSNNIVEMIPYSKIRIGINADDKMNQSENVLGITRWQLFLNDQKILSINHSKLDFSHNRYMNAYGDYKTYKEMGKWYQGLYRLPYNQLPIYEGENGILSINGNNPIKIILSDINGNQSTVQLSLQYKPSEVTKDSGSTCDYVSDRDNHIAFKDLRFTFNKEDIYEPTCIVVTQLGSNKYADIYQIGHTGIPLHGWSQLQMRLKQLIPFSLRKKLVFIHKVKEESLPGAHPQSAVAATYDNGHVKALIRTLGTYEVSIDTIAPAINFLFKPKENLKGKKSISFTVKENMTNIQSCHAYINDEWICFARKGDTFTYTIDERMPKANSYTLKVVATDDNGNERVKSIAFGL